MKAIWTLLCRDEMKDNHTKLYPPWYANPLARSLEPYGIQLNVLTDQAIEVERAAEVAGIENLYVVAIRAEMSSGLRFKPSGWWNKMLFYNPEVFTGELFFVDLDSIFIKDPSPIFEYAAARPEGVSMIHEAAVFSWNLPVRTIASPLFFLDHRREGPAHVWNRFSGESGLPQRDGAKYHPVRMRGDQDFVEWAVLRSYPDRKDRTRVCQHWPINFYSRYKVFHAFKGWEAPGKHYRGYTPEDFICHGFNGRPKIEDIVSRRLPGWTLYREFLVEYELEELAGFEDPNARGGYE